MRAFLSGEAGVAVVLTPSLQVRPVNGPVTTPWHSADALQLFEGCGDVHAVNVASADELDHLTREAWAGDRALRLFLFLIDPHEPDDELSEYAECIEELITNPSILYQVKCRLAAGPLKTQPDAIRVGPALGETPAVQGLFRWTLAVQPFVAQARTAFDLVPLQSFGGELARSRTQRDLIENGAFMEVVVGLSSGLDLSPVLHHSRLLLKNMRNNLREVLRPILAVYPKIKLIQPRFRIRRKKTVKTGRSRQTRRLYGVFSNVQN